MTQLLPQLTISELYKSRVAEHKKYMYVFIVWTHISRKSVKCCNTELGRQTHGKHGNSTRLRFSQGAGGVQFLSI
jgi:hypothetical protein